VILLAASGLLMRSLRHALDVRVGFDPDHILAMNVNRAPKWSRDSIRKFYDVALDRLAKVSGVSEVAIADCPPLAFCARAPIVLHDRPPVPAGTEPSVGIHWITPSWPSVAKVPLLRGRLFTRDDDLGRPRVVLINSAAARAFWPNVDPIGKTVSVGGTDTATVVGVVGDVLYGSIGEPANPDVYVSYYQVPFTYRMMLFVKTRVPPMSVAPAVRRALAEVAPGFPAYHFHPLTENVSVVTSDLRVSALLISLFAFVALGLAVLGTYGVISYAVAQRTREIGIRMALGAAPSNVTRLVVGQGAALAGVGGAFGLLGALVFTRFLRSLLFDVDPSDPVTLVAIAVVLAVAALAASWIPARRAAGIPVVRALRGG
jgi:predicted permease